MKARPLNRMWKRHAVGWADSGVVRDVLKDCACQVEVGDLLIVFAEIFEDEIRNENDVLHFQERALAATRYLASMGVITLTGEADTPDALERQIVTLRTGERVI